MVSCFVYADLVINERGKYMKPKGKRAKSRKDSKESVSPNQSTMRDSKDNHGKTEKKTVEKQIKITIRPGKEDLRGALELIISLAPLICFWILITFSDARLAASISFAAVCGLFAFRARVSSLNLLDIFTTVFFAFAIVMSFLYVGTEKVATSLNFAAASFVLAIGSASYFWIGGEPPTLKAVTANRPESVYLSPVYRKAHTAASLIMSAGFALSLMISFSSIIAGTPSKSVALNAACAISILATAAAVLICLYEPKRIAKKMYLENSLTGNWKPSDIDSGLYHAEGEYDAVIIGGGISGLVSAAILSKSGLKVALIEKRKRVGGLCTSFNIEDTVFDLGAQSVLGADEGGVLQRLNSDLNIEGIDFKRVSEAVVSGSIRTVVPTDSIELRDKLCEKFQNHKDSIEKLFCEIDEFEAEWKKRSRRAKLLYPADLDDVFRFMDEYPVTAKWQNLSYERMMREFFKNTGEDIGNLMRVPLKILGSGEAETPAFIALRMLLAVFSEGRFHIGGGAFKYVSLLKKAISEEGVELIVEGRVKQIKTEEAPAGRRVCSVELENGEALRTSNVLLTTEPHLISELVDWQGISGYAKSLNALPRSCSAVTIAYALNQRFDIPDRVHIFLKEPLRIRSGEGYLQIDYIECASSCLKDEGIAKKGRMDFSVTFRVPESNFRLFEDEDRLKKLKDEIDRVLRRAIETNMPIMAELSDSVTDRRVISPAEIARISGSSAGSMWGFKTTMKKNIYELPSAKTPLRGLYLAGSWGRFSGGIESAVLNGVMASSEIVASIKD